MIYLERKNDYFYVIPDLKKNARNIIAIILKNVQLTLDNQSLSRSQILKQLLNISSNAF